MANILFQPDLWSDYNTNSPPAYWNGTDYSIDFYSQSTGTQFQLNLMNDPPAGSTVDFQVSFGKDVENQYPLDPGPVYLIYIGNSSDAPIFVSPPLDFTPTSLSFVPTEAGRLIFNNVPSAIFTSNVYHGTMTLGVPPPPPVTKCEELGRSTRAIVSGYNRSRVHTVRLYYPEKRCMIANLNGAIPQSRSIVKVVWQTIFPYVTYIDNARIVGKEVMVDLTSQYPGRSWVRCSAYLDNGEIYVQQFQIVVISQPFYAGDAYLNNGPMRVEAEA